MTIKQFQRLFPGQSLEFLYATGGPEADRHPMWWVQFSGDCLNYKNRRQRNRDTYGFVGVGDTQPEAIAHLVRQIRDDEERKVDAIRKELSQQLARVEELCNL